MTTAVFLSSFVLWPFRIGVGQFFTGFSVFRMLALKLSVEALILVSKRLFVRVPKHGVDEPVRLT